MCVCVCVCVEGVVGVVVVYPALCVPTDNAG